ncbi:MAG: 16S rRNA (cytidine(1402)-2'-O)-methyltransferase [Caldimicrobium sp.]
MSVLYIVALPIGNLKDITLRAIEVLNEVDIVLTEDTRSFKKLAYSYKISPKKVISFYKEVEKIKEDQVVQWLKDGKKIALCSEAGTPLLSDPGNLLVRRLYEEDIKIVPIPGPSSLTTALSVCPFDLSQGFIFLGFLPRKEKEIENKLKKLPPDLPIVLFIPPHRFNRTIKSLVKYLGEREVFLARELTKVHEELKISTLTDLLHIEEIKGEITLIIGPRLEREENRKSINLEDIKKDILNFKRENFRPREIVKKLREKYQISSKELYNLLKALKE